MQLREGKGVLEYLKKRNLLKQYKSAKAYFEADNFKIIDTKPRKPKKLGVFQFKINKKYRAFYVIRKEGAVVFRISDHQ